ncbi:MAG: glycosyltransferase family 2 protein [Planctomycetia bacterium]|nr:glycosyltransferase family 2 protein [Planctomycetia bacterium]
MKHISILTPCYNEEANVRELYEDVKKVFSGLPQYTYDHLFIDNASKDNTPIILREIAAQDKNVRVIFNTRNFGHIRSPYHGLLQTTGDATIGLACDFQDPPALIPEFLGKWEQGYKVVLGVKTASDESAVMFACRSAYYNLINRLAEVNLVKGATGFGLYDRAVVEALTHIDDPYPYFRGLLSDIGYATATIAYHQPARRHGLTKNNFYTLYDVAMLGITNHSKVPLRLATMAGFAMSAISLLVALGYFIAKLVNWNHFTLGMAPVIIGLFFFSSVQLFFIGILGEYIGAIHTQVQKRPLVIERERLNF